MSFRTQIFRLKAGRKALKLDHELREGFGLNREDLDRLNWRRRVSLVRHCQEHVPYYRKLFKLIGFDYRDMKTESDFLKIPILEKSQIRANEGAIISETVERSKLKPSTTGGTTGEPLRVFGDPALPVSVMTWRMLNQWGVDVSDNSGYLYRAVPKGIRRLASGIALLPTRRVYLAAAKMNVEQMFRFYRQLRRIKPRYLVGYVGALDAFADFLEMRKLCLPSLRVVWSTAAPLPEMKRKQLEDTYDCPVYSQYGCVEMFMIAAESDEKNGLYVAADVRHVEIVENDRIVPVGEYGDVVVTDLTNYAFPLLRYRVGDRSRFLNAANDAQLNLPRIDYVQGRITDNVHLPDGSSVAGEFWTTIFDDYPDDIKSFQVVQRRDYSLEIRFVPKSKTYASAIEKVRTSIFNKMRGAIPLKFVESELNSNENGKTRFVVSELKK